MVDIRRNAVDAFDMRRHLNIGQVIPAHPLALLPTRGMDERHQRALTRYYVAAGAGGMAVGVHTTGFAIHDAKIGLYRPVLELAAETANEALARDPRAFVRVAGLIGDTAQAVREAQIAQALGYHCGLLSLGAWRDATEPAILAHCAQTFAKWQLPDDVLYVESIPLTSTGKMDKKIVRANLEKQGYRLPDLRG